MFFLSVCSDCEEVICRQYSSVSVRVHTEAIEWGCMEVHAFAQLLWELY